MTLLRCRLWSAAMLAITFHQLSLYIGALSYWAGIDLSVPL